MNIVLTGFMGTGKTAVGRQVADKLRVPFRDVDAEIEKRAKKTIADIFTHEGEKVFRTLESKVITEFSGQDRSVIATGGGALMAEANRQHLQKNGVLVCLRAKAGTLLDRLKDDVTRPLLAGENLEARMERLMKERESIYDECPVQVDTDGKTILQVADEIISKVSTQWH